MHSRGGRRSVGSSGRLDVRTPTDFETSPLRLPGARRVEPDAVDKPEFALDVAPDQMVVAYCTSVEEATSAAVAQKLRDRGFKRVRILKGGLGGWINTTRLIAPMTRGVAIKDFYWHKNAKGKWDVRWAPMGEGMVRFGQFFEMVAASWASRLLKARLVASELAGSLRTCCMANQALKD